VISSSRRLAAISLGAALAACASCSSAVARAEVPINDPDLSDGWAFTIGGRVNAYISYIWGETVPIGGFGNPIPDDFTGELTENRYRLIGPQIGIQGAPTPRRATIDKENDTDLAAVRIRGGFAATQLIFNLYKQLYDDLKLTVRVALWAGIEDGLDGNGNRVKNQARPVDVREQYFVLSGSWGSAWGGRALGLFNRGGMRMNWWLLHQHGVGHPCTVDDGVTASCGHTGVGSMFPSRNAQLGYATPELFGLQLSGAIFDPSHIDSPQRWNRAPYPRFEGELTYKNDLGDKSESSYRDELNVWANGLIQSIGRTEEQAPIPPPAPVPPGTQFPGGNPGVPADVLKTVWGMGGGAWARFYGAALGVTGWYGKGLGTAFPFGNTAVDGIGQLRTHYGYLAIANYRFWDWEAAAGYGSVNVVETDWDDDPINEDTISVIKEVRGISGKIAYHLHPSLVLSIDAMTIKNRWWRGEEQVANIVSAGAVAQF
jgi:hypothetical protein